MKRRVRTAIWLAVLCGGAAGAFFAWDRLARPWFGRWEVEQMMARYAESPDQETVDRLVAKLVYREVDAELGNRILALLVTPEIVTRSAYRSDREVMIATEYPCVIRETTGADARYDVWAWVGRDPPADLKLKLHGWEGVLHGDGAVQQIRMVGSDPMDGLWAAASPNAFQLGIRGQTYALHDAHGQTEPLPVGTHEATVLVACDVVCPTVQHRWQWPSSGGFPSKWIPSRVTNITPPPDGWIGPSDYHCQVKLPVTIRVAEPGGEEKIVLRTGPELDAAVRKALTVSVRTFPGGGMFAPASGIGIDAVSAPETLFLRAAFRTDPTGQAGDRSDTRASSGGGKLMTVSSMTEMWTSISLDSNQVFWFKGASTGCTKSASYFDLEHCA